MKKDYLEIVDAMMDAFNQTAQASRAENSDPWISESLQTLRDLVAGLPGEDEIMTAVYDVANAYTYNSMLFGIQAAQALQAVSKDPGKLGKYIIDRRKGV